MHGMLLRFHPYRRHSASQNCSLHFFLPDPLQKWPGYEASVDQGQPCIDVDRVRVAADGILADGHTRALHIRPYIMLVCVIYTMYVECIFLFLSNTIIMLQGFYVYRKYIHVILHHVHLHLWFSRSVHFSATLLYIMLMILTHTEWPIVGTSQRK